MQTLTRADLMTLETYAVQRQSFREQVLAHKQPRKVRLGDHAILLFEDRLTIQYQIQEMLRVERIFEPAGIEDELNAYNPLIPDGSNLKATFLIEYEDVAERKQALSQLKGVEDKVWMQVEGYEPVWAIADEDLERENDEKTSSVHFVRFEFDPAMIAALKEGAALGIGIDHPAYQYAIPALAASARNALVADFA